MYNHMAKKITSYLLKNNIGHQNYRDIYEYGFECGFSIIANIIIVICIGFILNIQGYLITYMAVYTLMRINTGGFHCKNHITCIITYLIMSLASILAFWLLKGYIYRDILVYLSLFLSIAMVILFAPVASTNKKINDKLRKDLKTKGIFTVIILSIIIICLTVINGYTIITISGTAALLVQSLTLIPFLNKNIKYIL